MSSQTVSTISPWSNIYEGTYCGTAILAKEFSLRPWENDVKKFNNVLKLHRMLTSSNLLVFVKIQMKQERPERGDLKELLNKRELSVE
ncbi:hypothetical protein THRCLA_09896 [Thraustotheca clavata]|uniref:Uncharacterized protein n=1 Tax=Thraustotheca clavata TaxID=74557 RepID=A0A1V9YTR2_9STRA|nr:hypothetical protein THRCLA_09896 [Thraustotheca clavata]